MTVQNHNELVRISHFALKCYGWDLNDVEAAIVQKMAHFGVLNVRIVDNTNMIRVLRNIAWGYKDIMEYKKHETA